MMATYDSSSTIPTVAASGSGRRACRDTSAASRNSALAALTNQVKRSLPLPPRGRRSARSRLATSVHRLRTFERRQQRRAAYSLGRTLTRRRHLDAADGDDPRALGVGDREGFVRRREVLHNLPRRGDIGAELGQIQPTAAQITPGSGWIPAHVSALGIAALPPHHPLRDRRIQIPASQLHDLLTRHVHHPSPPPDTAPPRTRPRCSQPATRIILTHNSKRR